MQELHCSCVLVTAPAAQASVAVGRTGLATAPRTSRPLEARTWAMPAPIWPAPTTPTSRGKPLAMVTIAVARRGVGPYRGALWWVFTAL